MTIAVTGATGHLGRLAISALKSRNAAIVALARDPAKAADLGVPTRAFDYTAPAGHAAALAGIDTLVLISSNDFNDRAGQHKAVIAAAKAAGVGRIIYTSILKGDASPMLLAQDHIATEAAILASGLPYTILRNGWYTENLTGSLAGAVAAGTMIGASGNGQIASAARADFAQAIAVTAATEGHAGQIYELAGDTARSMNEFAAEVSKLVGKPIGYADMPQAVYAETLVSFGLPAGFAAILADSDAQAANGALFDDSKTLSRLIGRPTTPVSTTITAALG